MSIGLLADITTNLEAYYTFDNNINDSTVNARHLSVDGGGVASYGAGKIGSGSYIFNGVDNYLSSLNVFANSLDGSFSFWLKASPVVGESWLLSSHNGANPFFLLSDDTKLLARDASGDTDVVNNPGAIDNTWHYIAVTFAGNDTAIIYVDGVALVNDINAVENINIRNTLNIGHYLGLSLFTGEMDDVRIYSRVLTPADVGELFAYVAPPAAPAATVVKVPISQSAYLFLAFALLFIGIWQKSKKLNY